MQNSEIKSGKTVNVLHVAKINSVHQDVLPDIIKVSTFYRAGR